MNTFRRFEADRLRSELAGLPPRLRTLFATLSARRLARAYPGSGHHDDNASKLFADLHGYLWQSLVTEPADPADATVAAARALALLPAEGGDDALAEDAAASLTYALRTLAGADPTDAVWAAQRACEALDSFLQQQGLDPNANDGEEALVGHPLMQAELERQAEDLRMLHRLATGTSSPDAFYVLRDMADEAAGRLFG